MRHHAVLAAIERGYMGRQQLLVPACQRALGHQRLEHRGDAQHQRRNIGERLEHIRHHAAVGVEAVVEVGNLGRNLIALNQRHADGSRRRSGHENLQNKAIASVYPGSGNRFPIFAQAVKTGNSKPNTAPPGRFNLEGPRDRFSFQREAFQNASRAI